MLEGGDLNHLFPRPSEWAACGFSGKIDYIQMLIMKHEEKLSSEASSSLTTIAKGIIDYEIPQVYVMQAISNASSSLLVEVVTQMIRFNGHRVVNNAQNLLFGMIPDIWKKMNSVSLQVALLHRYGIKVVVLVSDDEIEVVKLYPRKMSTNISSIKKIGKDGSISCSLDTLLQHVKTLLGSQSSALRNESFTDQSTSVESASHNRSSTTSLKTVSQDAKHIDYSRTVALIILDVGNAKGAAAGKQPKRLRQIEKQVSDYFLSVLDPASRAVEVRVHNFPSLASMNTLTTHDYKVIACDIPFIHLRGFGTNLLKWASSLQVSVTANATGSSKESPNDFKGFIALHPHRRVLKMIIQEFISYRHVLKSQLPSNSSGDRITIYLYSSLDDMADMLLVNMTIIDAQKNLLSAL